MKIGIEALSAKSLYHGIGVYISNLLPRLVSQRLNHTFVVYSSIAMKEHWLKTLSQCPVEWQFISSNRALRLFWQHTFLPLSLKKKEVELFWGAHIFLPRLKVCKYIVTIHDLSSLLFPKYHSFFRRIHHQNSIIASVALADCIITVSESSKCDLIKFFSLSNDRVKVIYNGVDNIFQPIKSQDELLKVREKYHLPSRFILFLGVLEPKKNVERLLLAYAKLKQSFSDLPKLITAGGRSYGWRNKKIFELIRILKLEDNVSFIDFVAYEDLPALYNLAELFVFPSIYEGFGLPVIEAMACGTPVITSNTSALAEIAGGAAVLVNPYDVSDIVKAIKEVLLNKEKQKEMIEKGFDNVKRFSWERAAHQILEVFDEVYKKR